MSPGRKLVCQRPRPFDVRTAPLPLDAPFCLSHHRSPSHPFIPAPIPAPLPPTATNFYPRLPACVFNLDHTLFSPLLHTHSGSSLDATLPPSPPINFVPSSGTPEESSPISSNGMDDEVDIPTGTRCDHCVPAASREEIERLKKARDAVALGRDALVQENEGLKEQAATFSTECKKLQKTTEELKQGTELIHSDVARKEFDVQVAELFKLMNDGRELQESIQASLVTERDMFQGRWAREFNERRKLFNSIQELRGNIRVFCRVRPPKQKNARGTAVQFPDAVVGDHGTIQVSNKSFEFDHVFQPSSSQQDVYGETAGVVQSVVDGYNVCVFAYGQTGSGKTHTMNGTSEDPGVNVRALEDLLKIANQRKEHSDVQISVSMLEIYNENLRDLIRFDKSDTAPKLVIRKDPTSPSATVVHVPNLTEVSVNSFEDIWEVMERGSQNRSNGRTNMNEHSSRSHLILRIMVKCENKSSDVKTSGVLYLVDLAGSERVARSNSSGDRLKEAQHINKSLAALGDVFTALTSNSSHIPYRNSRLTYLLQDCIGGDSKTLMFVNVSCDESDVSETTSSLQFAQRVALGNANRHMKSTSEKKVKATLHGKEGKLAGLQLKLSVAQRDLKKRDDVLSELKQKFKALEVELELTKNQLTEQAKRDAGNKNLAKELRDLKVMRERDNADARAENKHMRDLLAAKDAEIRRLTAAAQDPKIQEQVPATATATTLVVMPDEVASSDTVADDRDDASSAETLDRLMSAPTVGTMSAPRRVEQPPSIRVPRSNTTIPRGSRMVRFDESDGQGGRDGKKPRGDPAIHVPPSLGGAARRVKDSVTTSIRPQSSMLSRPTRVMPPNRPASAASATAGSAAVRNSYNIHSRLKSPTGPASGGGSGSADGLSASTPTAGGSSLAGPSSSGAGPSSLSRPPRVTRVPRANTNELRPPQRTQCGYAGARASGTTTPSGLRSSGLRRAGTVTGVSRIGAQGGSLTPR